MSSDTVSRHGAVAAALAVAVGHVAVAYIHIRLFEGVTFGGWPAVVPWLFGGAYALALVGTAVGCLRHTDAAGTLVATGTTLLAVDLFASAYVVGAGCELAAADGVLPSVALRGPLLALSTPGGACITAVSLPALAAAPALVALGLRRGALAAAVARVPTLAP